MQSTHLFSLLIEYIRYTVFKLMAYTVHEWLYIRRDQIIFPFL